MSAFYNSLDFALSVEVDFLLEGNARIESQCTKEGPCTRSTSIGVMVMQMPVLLPLSRFVSKMVAVVSVPVLQ